MDLSFTKSTQWLERSLNSIPSATQTFSKSTYFMPKGICPHFAESAQGCVLRDIDGNEYVDFINALLCISLGYSDPDVNQAVTEQLQSGAIFSLPHRLETEVAELIINLVPCAESVRFGKNGSDATSAAVRLARAYTQKKRIAVCGYHGWQDWYIGSTTRDLGVPEEVKSLTHAFTYNDIDSLSTLFAAHKGEFAAVIMEPMNVEFPQKGFLQQVQALCKDHECLLIFDETITGFRFHMGGAQTLLGVTPDLATFGKGISNGLPLSAITGRKEIMALMEDIFFSGTFGGDTLALAAAKATIQKMRQCAVPDYLTELGSILIEGLNSVIASHQLKQYFSVKGHPTWSFLVPDATHHKNIWVTKTYITQELVKCGFLSLGSHNLSYAHQTSHIEALLSAYDNILPKVVELAQSNRLLSSIEGELIEPIFKVR